jgi:hypothetical protein
MCLNALNLKYDGKNDARVKKGKSSALLYAHRCFLKDLPIKVPFPLNSIPDSIVPSHVVVLTEYGILLITSIAFEALVAKRPDIENIVCRLL